MRNRYILAAACLCLLYILTVVGSTLAAGFVPVNDTRWNESAVRKVLHTFAYGGFATDAQIKTWANMPSQNAIREMLTFDPVNEMISPIQDNTPTYGSSLEDLQYFLSSNAPDNNTCPTRQQPFAETFTRADGNVVLRNLGLQHTWIQAVNKRGMNPFRHMIGFWLTNYQMAVNLHDTKPPLIRELYDSALDALAQGAPFHEVLAVGATSAAVAREYGHRSNTYNNNTGVFRGNDDFAREFHQLFFRINGDIEDPDYHEDTTIEHTAWALTGMQLDKEPNAYGTTLPSHWWVAPIDFTDHVDATGRTIRNFRRHYRGDLEILHEFILGNTAEEKLHNLAATAIWHPESLDNLPVGIVNFFADDNLTAGKIVAIRQAWLAEVGTPRDLLRFLQAYAISTTFHRQDTYKYRTAFSRNMTVYNLNTVDNEESYGNSFSPRYVMRLQGAEVFIPVHDVFGGQTSLNAANNPNLFKEAYNNSVNFPNRVAKTVEVCRDNAGTRLWTWRKDWSRVIPALNGVYLAKEVGEWLWERFISDNRTNYGPLEHAQVTALLATGMDFGYLVAPSIPDIAYSATELTEEPLVSIVTANEEALLDLDSPVVATRREANRRVGMAINFITMTPFMFASEGTLAVAPTPVTVPDVVGLTQAQAEGAITAAGLTVGAVTVQNSDTVPAGDVISQNPAAGTSAVPGSTVDLVVSSGSVSDQPPLVTISAPSDGATFIEGDLILFGGTADDAEDGDLTANLTWSSNLDGVIGGGGSFSTTLSVGTHTITASVTDLSAQPGSDAIVVTVNVVTPGNQRPLVTIDAPSDGTTFNEGDAINFSGMADDAEDGDLTADLSWSSNLDGVIGGGGSFSTTLSVGTHTITASVTDSNAQPDSDAIVVIVQTSADSLECKKATYKVGKDELSVEVKSTDRTGGRTLTAVIDVNGDGIFERNLGGIPIKPGTTDTYKRKYRPFDDPNPTATSVVRVTSDLGGVCSRHVKIDY